MGIVSEEELQKLGELCSWLAEHCKAVEVSAIRTLVGTQWLCGARYRANLGESHSESRLYLLGRLDRDDVFKGNRYFASKQVGGGNWFVATYAGQKAGGPLNEHSPFGPWIGIHSSTSDVDPTVFFSVRRGIPAKPIPISIFPISQDGRISFTE